MTGPRLLVALIALTAACGGRSNDTAVAPEERTVLRVENDAFNDMRIFVWQGSQRIRLGVANGKSVSTFRIPRSVMFGMTSLRFEADPIGGGGKSISEQITVSPGEEIVLRIPPV
ncbi:MAG: hypothetical protein ACRENB_15870 [Gemmatimonadales bacterium]